MQSCSCCGCHQTTATANSTGLAASPMKKQQSFRQKSSHLFSLAAVGAAILLAGGSSASSSSSLVVGAEGSILVPSGVDRHRAFQKNPRRKPRADDDINNKNNKNNNRYQTEHNSVEEAVAAAKRLLAKGGPPSTVSSSPSSDSDSSASSSSLSSSSSASSSALSSSFRAIHSQPQPNTYNNKINNVENNNTTNNKTISSGANGQTWTSWIGLPSPRIGGQAIQTDHFLFIIGGSSEAELVSGSAIISSDAGGDGDADSIMSSTKSLPAPPRRMVHLYTGAEATAAEVQKYEEASQRRLRRRNSNNKEKEDEQQFPSVLYGGGGTAETDVFLFIDLLVLYKFVPLSLADVIPPIVSKAGVALVGYDMFMCYACSVMNNGTVSGTFLKVSLPPGELWSLEDVPPPQIPVRMLSPSIQRFGASMGQYSYYVPSNVPDTDMNIVDALPITISYLYVFGGRDVDMNPISTVEQFFNNTWSTIAAPFPKPYCFCSVTQGIYGDQGDDALFITDCHDCKTWAPVPDAVVFLPVSKTFVFSNTSDGADIPTSLLWPAKPGAASNNLMGTMLPGLTYSPSAAHPNDPLALLLYDTTALRQINYDKYRPTEMQVARTNCAVFSVAGYLMCIGGQSIATKEASSMGDAVQMRPNIYAMPDRTDGIYFVGETPNVLTSGSCGTNTQFMVTTDPNCNVQIPFTSMFKCAVPETQIPISHLTVGPDQEVEMYICATDGTCVVDPADRVQCNSGVNLADEYSCLWARCCWDENANNSATTGLRCFQPGPATLGNQLTTSWMQTTLISSSQNYNPRPIVLMQATKPASDSTPFPKWLMIVMAVVGVGLISLLVALLVRYNRQRRQMLKRRAYATNAFFTAFGKAYSVQGLIGQGSYGAVFLAERARDKRLVALKIIPCLNYKQRDMALKEFDLLNHLDHPHLIPVLDLIINWDSREQNYSSDSPFDTISKKSRLQFEAQQMPHSESVVGSELGSQYGGVGVANVGSRDDMGGGFANGSSGGSGGRGGAATSGPNSNEREAKSSSALSPTRSSKAGGTNGSGLTNSGGLSPSSANKSVSGMERESLLKGNDLSDMIPNSSRLPSRFICIATEFFPEGDLTRFVVSYPRRGAILIGDNDPLECVMHYEQVDTNNPAAAVSARRLASSSAAATNGNSSATHATNATSANYGSVNNSQQDAVVSSRSLTGSSAGGGGASARHNTNAAFAALSGGSPQHTRPIPEGIVLTYAIQIADVLAYMHGLTPPLVHRDLKPDNVLVDKDRVVVTDFGLSSWQTSSETGVGADTCVGTLFFTAPEALGGPSAATMTPAVDCWALGCIIYAVCTRRVLPEATRVMFSDVDDDDFEEQIRGDLSLGNYSTAVADIVIDLLQREPEERMKAAACLAALKEALAALRNGGGSQQDTGSVGGSIRNFLSRRD